VFIYMHVYVRVCVYIFHTFWAHLNLVSLLSN